LQEIYPKYLDFVKIIAMKIKKLSLIKNKTRRNPHYVKIGKRIHQARMMAKESNSRALSVRRGWSFTKSTQLHGQNT